MRRRGRNEPKHGLAAERRQLVHRYMEAASPAAAEPDPEPVAPQLEVAAATTLVPQPPLVEPELARPVAPPAIAERPLLLEPLGPQAFDATNRMLEEVVRLCEQLARLATECDRQRGLLAGASST